MKTAELTGAALDWAVAQAEGLLAFGFWHDSGTQFAVEDSDGHIEGFRPSTDWAQGGPIIEREGIAVMIDTGVGWCAWLSEGAYRTEENSVYGDTPLIAAMRCYVASVMGDEVDVPAELMETA